MAEQEEKLYRVKEACALLGIHPNTLRRWDKEGKIRVVRPEGGYRRIPTSEVNRILEGKAVPRSLTLHPSGDLSSFLDYVFSHQKGDWSLVRRAVLIRDSHTCQGCGSKKSLDVVHKDGTTRNDPDNLITLCKNCRPKLSKPKNSKPKPPVHKKEPPKPPAPAPARPPPEPPAKAPPPAPAATPPAAPRPAPPKAPARPPSQAPPRAPARAPPPPQPPRRPVELQRHAIIDQLAPAGLAQRKAFGDLLSAATVLGTFTLAQLISQASCPGPIARAFCDRMISHGFLLRKGGALKMNVRLAK